VGRWLEREGIDPAKVAWYEDTESGRVSRRPAFDRLRADVRAGRRRTVVVYALDRLSRDFFDGIELLGNWLKAGARVASVTEPVDLSGELGQALAGVIFALAAAEWRKRRDRQKAGIEVAKGRGVYQGRRPGTTKGKPARAAEMRDRGLRAREIGAALGVSERTVWRYLEAADTAKVAPRFVP
jgi:DNA invertase Pin-like site-specific DNA recombinase